MTKREKLLRAALKRSMVALDDWLHQYASEQCDEKRVNESWKRIHDEGGTLAYLARVQRQNREALKHGLPTAASVRGILKGRK